MGMMADRAVKFVIAASPALAIMCFETWWRFNFFTTDYTIRGLNGDAVTRFDGVIVLAAALVSGGAALVGLIQREKLRLAGIATSFAGSVSLVVTTFGIIEPPSRVSPVMSYLSVQAHYHPTPILYFAAATSFLIGLAGVTMALARPDRTGQEQFDEGVTAWA